MESFVQLLKDAEHTIVFSGAGMSTESGLPDFRSKDSGLWELFDPTQLATVTALSERREDFIAFYQYRLKALMDVEPHTGHYILGNWEKQGLINGIITQNVDGFHHDAGSEHVMELHGSFRTFHCHTCQSTYEPVDFAAGMTTCSCGGTIRPDIVLFGESLPEATFAQAELESRQADLFIVLGSSLTVSPANMFPIIAKENKAKLMIVNRDPTPLDGYADKIIRDMSIKEFLETLAAMM